jgi:hypothetical protein
MEKVMLEQMRKNCEDPTLVEVLGIHGRKDSCCGLLGYDIT